MTVNGYLTDFSLPELFQLFERGHKTGLLTVTPNVIGPVGMPVEMVESDGIPNGQEGELGLVGEQGAGRSMRCHYIWFYRGRIVASASRLDQKELGLQLQSLGWLSERMALKLDQVYPRHRPLGTWLKSQGILQGQQLQKLFYRQVIRQVSQLLRLKGGRFQFYSKARLPFAEMTGISLPGSAVILQSLRRIRDWSSLITRLPAASSALISCRPQGERLKLSSGEWQVWDYTNGLLSLQSIADHLQISILEVRKIAYRLILAGLAEERVQDEEDSSEFMSIQYASAPGRSRSISMGESAVPFFQSLVGFIRNQATDAIPHRLEPMLQRISHADFTGLSGSSWDGIPLNPQASLEFSDLPNTPDLPNTSGLPNTTVPGAIPRAPFHQSTATIGASNHLNVHRRDRQSNISHRDRSATIANSIIAQPPQANIADLDSEGISCSEPNFLSTI